MSDWLGVYSVDLSIKAGLDLEMPGSNKWRTLDLVNRSIQSRKLTTRVIRERARSVLQLVQKCARGAPEVRYLSSSLGFDIHRQLLRLVGS